eukprot:CAMPEP_0204535704 /NCGR_PEP_ID=MMETSP0661-20131031/13905_1 /ASSEMBLY_ACC=CAM_ASM_000606 /TAXON_ID=109239 /ORGANISM="Alexandrium margalefi, Strain AMGDE01CS-322" /LENGTH=131 /DNA_ID=CAMNT_0051542203 /DNA_START=21 /DNA_END=412 /DNA_ORIENTATION=+
MPGVNGARRRSKVDNRGAWLGHAQMRVKLHDSIAHARQHGVHAGGRLVGPLCTQNGFGLGQQPLFKDPDEKGVRNDKEHFPVEVVVQWPLEHDLYGHGHGADRGVEEDGQARIPKHQALGDASDNNPDLVV